MTERQYSEEEVSAIFELATKAQSGGAKQLRSGDGMTLAGLQEIGREVGIPPELVAQAARSLDRQGTDTTRTLAGFPIGVGRTVNLGRKVSDAEWDQFVVTLRETFDATGRVKQDGAFRQWSNGNLQFLLEPTPTGHQLRMRTVRSRSLGLMTSGLGTFVVAAAMLVTSAPGKGISAALFMGAAALGMFAWGALVLPGWSRLRKRQMEELASRLTSPGE
jgi:hypothetical protein